MTDEYLYDRIREYLKKQTRLVTTQQIADATGVCRATVRDTIKLFRSREHYSKGYELKSIRNLRGDAKEMLYRLEVSQ